MLSKKHYLLFLCAIAGTSPMLHAGPFDALCTLVQWAIIGTPIAYQSLTYFGGDKSPYHPAKLVGSSAKYLGIEIGEFKDHRENLDIQEHVNRLNDRLALLNEEKKQALCIDQDQLEPEQRQKLQETLYELNNYPPTNDYHPLAVIRNRIRAYLDDPENNPATLEYEPVKEFLKENLNGILEEDRIATLKIYWCDIFEPFNMTTKDRTIQTLWLTSHNCDGILFRPSGPSISYSSTPRISVGDADTIQRLEYDLTRSQELLRTAPARCNRFSFLVQREGHLIKNGAFATSIIAMIGCALSSNYILSGIGAGLASLGPISSCMNAYPKSAALGSGVLRILGALLTVGATFVGEAQCMKFVNQKAEDAITDQKAVRGGINILKEKYNHTPLLKPFYPYFSNEYRLKKLQSRLIEPGENNAAHI